MKRRIANRLIRMARRLDPNSCVDFIPTPPRPAVVRVGSYSCDVQPRINVDERLRAAGLL